MLNLIRAEMFELRKSKAVKISILVSILCAIALIVVSHYIATGDLGIEAAQSGSALSEVMIMSLLGSLLAGIIVCTDFETKTIHSKIACSKSRSTIVFSKVIVFVIMMAILMLPYIIATLVAVSMGLEFAKPFVASIFLGILSETSGTSITLSIVGKIIALSLGGILVYAARVSICIPLSFKVKKPMAIMGIGFTLSGLLDFVLGLLLDVDIVKDIIALTPYYRDYMVTSMDNSMTSLIKIAVISIVFIIIMTFISVKMFKKAEIK